MSLQRMTKILSLKLNLQFVVCSVKSAQLGFKIPKMVLDFLSVSLGSGQTEPGERQPLYSKNNFQLNLSIKEVGH